MAEKTNDPTTTTTAGSSSIIAAAAPFPLPRVTIKFCTQCKWMLRAAYYAQELLSTFSTSLGEVALQPSTGGTFVVEIVSAAGSPDDAAPTTPTCESRVLWDRKTDGGFPETKELKRRVRDVIEPGRDLGHVDRDHHRRAAKGADPGAVGGGGAGGEGEKKGQQQHEQDKRGVESGQGSEKAATAVGHQKDACEDCQ